MEIIYKENIDLKNLFYDKNQNLKSCFIEITELCNFKCSHCYIPNQHKCLMNFETFKYIIDELSVLGCENLLITGGEPFIHPEFIKMYLYAHQKIKFISINTNLSLLTEDIIRTFLNKKPYSIEVSIYGCNESTYYQFTNVHNMYSKVIANIMNLKSNNIPILLKIPLTKTSINYINKIIEFANLNNLFLKFDYTIFPQLDSSKEKCKDTRLSPIDVINFITNNITTIDYFYSKVNSLENEWNEFLFSCIAGKEAIYIDTYGYIKMCMVAERTSLNIHKNTIREALQQFDIIRSKLKFQDTNICKNCNKKKICKFCPARFKLETGDYQKRPDWYCKIADAILNFNWSKRLFVYADKVVVNSYINDMFNIIKENQNGTDNDFEIWKKSNIDNAKYKMILCILENKVIGYLEYYEENDYYYWCETQIDKRYQRDKETLLGIYKKFIQINKEEKVIKCKINNKHSIDVHEHIGFKKEINNLYSIQYNDLINWISSH